MIHEPRSTGGLASVTTNGRTDRRGAGCGNATLKAGEVLVLLRHGTGEWRPVCRGGRHLADQQYDDALADLKAPRLTGVRMVSADGTVLREHERKEDQ